MGRKLHTIKVFWNKYQQLLSIMQTQQNAMKGIFNSSLFSLSSYCSGSATYSRREWWVPSPPPRLSNRRWKQGKEDALPATAGTAEWDLNPILTQISAKPSRDESPVCIFAELTSSGGEFTSQSLFLRAKPNQSPTLLKIILYATFAWGANLSPPPHTSTTVISDLDLGLTCSSYWQLYIKDN